MDIVKGNKKQWENMKKGESDKGKTDN
jgi:hypothetical protein